MQKQWQSISSLYEPSSLAFCACCHHIIWASLSIYRLHEQLTAPQKLYLIGVKKTQKKPRAQIAATLLFNRAVWPTGTTHPSRSGIQIRVKQGMLGLVVSMDYTSALQRREHPEASSEFHWLPPLAGCIMGTAASIQLHSINVTSWGTRKTHNHEPSIYMEPFPLPPNIFRYVCVKRQSCKRHWFLGLLTGRKYSKHVKTFTRKAMQIGSCQNSMATCKENGFLGVPAAIKNK